MYTIFIISKHSKLKNVLIWICCQTVCVNLIFLTKDTARLSHKHLYRTTRVSRLKKSAGRDSATWKINPVTQFCVLNQLISVFVLSRSNSIPFTPHPCCVIKHGSHFTIGTLKMYTHCYCGAKDVSMNIGDEHIS